MVQCAWIQLPVRGQLEVVGFSDTVACDTRRAAVASPTRNDFYLVRSGSGCGGIRLSLTSATLVGQLAALLGELPTAPLDFAPTIDLTTGYGRSLARYVLMAAADLEQAGSVLWSPMTMASSEQVIMTTSTWARDSRTWAGSRWSTAGVLARRLRKR